MRRDILVDVNFVSVFVLNADNSAFLILGDGVLFGVGFNSTAVGSSFDSPGGFGYGAALRLRTAV